MPAIGVWKLVVIVISAGKPSGARHRGRRDRVAPCKQMNIGGTMFQRHSCRVECGGSRADYTHGLATQGGEVDRIFGMRIAGGRQMRGQHFRNESATAAGKPGRENDLPCGLGGCATRRIEVQGEMVPGWLDPVQPCPIAWIDA